MALFLFNKRKEVKKTMKSKTLLVGILIAVILLAGCVMTFNLCNWSSSNTGFNNLINTLDTPKKAIDWLEDNCNYVKHSTAYSPYQVYAYKKYVCADASAFGRYAAHKHGYTSYDLILQFSDYNKTHSIAIYKVDGTYDNSSNAIYNNWNDSSLWAAANHAADAYTAHTVKSWYVNDYCNNVVDFKGITSKSIIYPIEGLYGTDTSSFIGEEAKNRAGLISGGRTIINKGNSAQYSGTVEKVGIWSYNTLYNVEVATFYKSSEDSFSTRDYQYIGTVYGGSAREYIVNLDVRAGDYIGMYFTGVSQAMERDTSGYSGIWHQGLDRIPCTNLEFNFMAGDAISLGGLVISW